MNYSIRHVTKFEYSNPITESLTEVRMQPLSEGRQICRRFELTVTPRVHVVAHSDHLGNYVHHFDVPRPHTQLLIDTKSEVEVKEELLPPMEVNRETWNQLDTIADDGEFDEMLLSSRFCESSNLLAELAASLKIKRRDDPMTVLRQLNSAIYETFEYVPQSTKVDSPIDDALRSRRGVCQDYSHIMITLARQYLRIPARYVSGYLFHRTEGEDRSATDATHAWVEALIPGLGWIGFDPTNNLIAAERHIRVGMGRDYSDVPPTRGVFKGEATSRLSVAVQATLADKPKHTLRPQTISTWSPPLAEEHNYVENQRLKLEQQQQQQQQ